MCGSCAPKNPLVCVIFIKHSFGWMRSCAPFSLRRGTLYDVQNQPFLWYIFLYAGPSAPFNLRCCALFNLLRRSLCAGWFLYFVTHVLVKISHVRDYSHLHLMRSKLLLPCGATLCDAGGVALCVAESLSFTLRGFNLRCFRPAASFL